MGSLFTSCILCQKVKSPFTHKRFKGHVMRLSPKVSSRTTRGKFLRPPTEVFWSFSHDKKSRRSIKQSFIFFFGGPKKRNLFCQFVKKWLNSRDVSISNHFGMCWFCNLTAFLSPDLLCPKYELKSKKMFDFWVMYGYHGYILKHILNSMTSRKFMSKTLFSIVWPFVTGKCLVLSLEKLCCINTKSAASAMCI